MARDQLGHLLRAASRIAGERDVFVIGSQAILGSYDDTALPDEAIGSIEADLLAWLIGRASAPDLGPW